MEFFENLKIKLSEKKELIIQDINILLKMVEFNSNDKSNTNSQEYQNLLNQTKFIQINKERITILDKEIEELKQENANNNLLSSEEKIIITLLENIISTKLEMFVFQSKEIELKYDVEKNVKSFIKKIFNKKEIEELKVQQEKLIDTINKGNVYIDTLMAQINKLEEYSHLKVEFQQNLNIVKQNVSNLNKNKSTKNTTKKIKSPN